MLIVRAAMLGSCALAALIVASTASSYDRKPIVLYGVYGDGWGQTITAAATNFQSRYHGTRGVYCVGAIINGDEGNSSWITGYVRAWDKVVCAGYARSGHVFTVIYDQKGSGPNAWTIYWLRGATVNELW
jgi:hypothetical protein